MLFQGGLSYGWGSVVIPRLREKASALLMCCCCVVIPRLREKASVWLMCCQCVDNELLLCGDTAAGREGTRHRRVRGKP
jgi:hypothetical protein